MRIIVRRLPAELPVEGDRIVHHPASWAFTTCGKVTIHDPGWVKRPRDWIVRAMDETGDRHEWCPGCFGADRCEVCRVPVLCNPPGRHHECLDCMQADLDRDKTLAQAS